MPFATDKIVKRDPDGRLGGPDAINPEQYVNLEQLRRTSGYEVSNATEVEALIAEYPPTPENPLMVIRKDTRHPNDVQITTDGIFWNRMQRLPAPFTYLESFTSGQDYSRVHHSTGYMKTSAGIVCITGLVMGVTSGQTIFTLPPGYRPSHRMLFPVITHHPTTAASHGRVDIDTNGNVIASQVSSGWVSIEIMFPCAEEVAALGGWKPVTLNSPTWIDYSTIDASWSTLGWIQDRLGRVWFKGLARQAAPSVLAADSTMFNIPFQTMNQIHYPGLGNGNTFASLDIVPGTGVSSVRAKTGSNTGWIAPTRCAFVPRSVRTDWVDNTINPQAWLRYNTVFPDARHMVFEDGIVFMDGLLASGSIGGVPGFMRYMPDEFSGDTGLKAGGNREQQGTMLFLTNSANVWSRTDIILDRSSSAQMLQAVQGGTNQWWSLGGVNYVLGG